MDGAEATGGQHLNPDLLALDDLRSRDALPDQWRPASRVLDAWLHREYGIIASHNEMGYLLALLEAEGYTVTPPARAGG